MIPVRMCMVCRRHRPQSELIRLKAEDGVAIIDTSKRRTGRGAYLCADADCIRLAEKKRAAERRLDAKACEGLYRKLEDMI